MDFTIIIIIILDFNAAAAAAVYKWEIDKRNVDEKKIELDIT